VGRAAAMQAAARTAGGAAPAGSPPPPPAGAGLTTAAVAFAVATALDTPGLQLFMLLRLVGKRLVDGCGLDDGAAAKAFARSGDAVAATLEALRHGCPGFSLGEERGRLEAATVLMLACIDVKGMRQMRVALPRIVPALVQRLERGAPGSTLEERLCVVKALQVRRGRTRQAGRRGHRGAGLRAALGVRGLTHAASRTSVGVWSPGARTLPLPS
jgi:hypothetical protein